MLQVGKTTSYSEKSPITVSVVCVTYNAVTTLNRMLLSYKNVNSNYTELIVIDGNSTDGTITILKENEGLIDFWASGPDNGIYDAMNKALTHISGKWIVFVGADDELQPGFSQLRASLKKANTIYYGNVVYYDKLMEVRYDDYYLTKLNFCHQAMFYPKAVFDKYKYDIKYKVYADYYLNLQCWKDPDFDFVHLNHLVSKFTGGGFSSVYTDDLFVTERDKIFKKFLKPASYYRYLNRTQGFWTMLKRFFA